MTYGFDHILDTSGIGVWGPLIFLIYIRDWFGSRFKMEDVNNPHVI